MAIRLAKQSMNAPTEHLDIRSRSMSALAVTTIVHREIFVRVSLPRSLVEQTGER